MPSMKTVLAPLLRGLFINALGSAVSLEAVGEETVGESADIHPDILELALSDSAVSSDGSLDEEKAAVELNSQSSKIGENQPRDIRLVVGGRRYFFAVSAKGNAFSKNDPSADKNSALGRSHVVSGKIAVVTGGAQGFGAEISKGLLASGASVYVADLNYDGAVRLCSDLNSQGYSGKAYPVSVNVAEEASVEALFDFIANTTGGLDLVVSNAGVLKASSVLEQDLKSFRFVTDVNYIGFFLMAKHAGLMLRRQRRTAPEWMTDIVQINSKSGLEGSNKNGAYAGSKFGSIGLVQSFALELVQYGIKVNAICPGNFFDGPLWSDPVNGLFVQYLRSGKVPGAKTVADVKEYYEAKVPMKRGTVGADVMRALYYLVEQKYETGQALPVTGGQVMLN